MTKETKQKLLFKKESERTKAERLIRDLVCYGIVIYVAILGYLFVNAQVNLANAQIDALSQAMNGNLTSHYVD